MGKVNLQIVALLLATTATLSQTTAPDYDPRFGPYCYKSIKDVEDSLDRAYHSFKDADIVQAGEHAKAVRLRCRYIAKNYNKSVCKGVLMLFIERSRRMTKPFVTDPSSVQRRSLSKLWVVAMKLRKRCELLQ